MGYIALVLLIMALLSIISLLIYLIPDLIRDKDYPLFFLCLFAFFAVSSILFAIINFVIK